MFVKHGKCYITESGNALKVQFVKDHNTFNVDIGWIRADGKVCWDYHCNTNSISDEVDIPWVEKEIHKNYDMILKHLCGEKIQFKDDNNEWIDVQNTTMFWLNNELRVKTKSTEYRTMLIDILGEPQVITITRSDSLTNEEVSKQAESNEYFIKWLSDWIKVKVE